MNQYAASSPITIATLARKVQNQANPTASAFCVGSAISPSEVKPVIATPRQTAAKIAAMITVICAEIFKLAAYSKEYLRC